eukprot:COSAG02_NODE_9836_length_2096_cov_2.207311_2_plen_91_part_00
MASKGAERVAMLGGTGALGRLVWPRLLQDGSAVTLLARGGQKRVTEIYPGAGAHQDRLAVIDGDALSPSTLANVLNGADTLYCALTPHRL